MEVVNPCLRRPSFKVWLVLLYLCLCLQSPLHVILKQIQDNVSSHLYQSPKGKESSFFYYNHNIIIMPFKKMITLYRMSSHHSFLIYLMILLWCFWVGGCISWFSFCLSSILVFFFTHTVYLLKKLSFLYFLQFWFC